jgi:threonine synthase
VKYSSTRGSAHTVTADQALLNGVAPDGGLYLPERLPVLPLTVFDGLDTLPDIASRVLTPFFEDSSLAERLRHICAAALDLHTPLVTPDHAQSNRHILELFHGPTGAFKDFGARFLMRCFSTIRQQGSPLTVLVATSGDTGGAVGCATEATGDIPTLILFPKGRISSFQEQQLCCWKTPVQALRMSDDFDACQALVKAAFADRALSERHGLSSANSINIGRFLPQMSYWATAALDLKRATGRAPGFVIPTGNLGNAYAALLARACGLPIGPVVLATNSNATLPDWFRSGEYNPRPSVATLANAMDVGAPSNFERLAAQPGFELLAVERVSDDEIQARLRSEFETSGYIACPHTATALEAHARLPEQIRSERPWVIGATAHPYKFADTIETVIDVTIQPPAGLADALRRPARVRDMAANLDQLASVLDQYA